MKKPATLLLSLALSACYGAHADRANARPTNDEFGFSVQFPPGLTSCRADSGGHPHGFYAMIGHNCSREGGHSRSIVIWANYNAANWDLSDLERLYCNKPRFSDPRVRSVPGIGNLPTKSCLMETKDGELILHALAERGSAATVLRDSSAKGGSVNYRVTLKTTREYLQEDYQTFISLISSIELQSMQN